MNAPATPPGGESTSVRELAARIYVELVGRVMLTTEQTKPNPVDLAKFCYKLAEAFQSIEVGAKADAVAKMAKYDVKVDDMTSWKK
ncbi:MAG TPA: hypothetical protein VIJ43_11550 [Burkholderiales bacterium]